MAVMEKYVALTRRLPCAPRNSDVDPGTERDVNISWQLRGRLHGKYRAYVTVMEIYVVLTRRLLCAPRNSDVDPETERDVAISWQLQGSSTWQLWGLCDCYGKICGAY